MLGPPSVDVAVIGTGRLGASLGTAFRRANLRVVEALTAARVVVIADPRESVGDLMVGLGTLLPTTIFVDATLGGAERCRLGTIVRHVKGAPVYRMLYPEGDETDRTPDVFYVGPDDEPRECIEGLIGCTGRRPVYLGGVDRSGALDSLIALRGARRIFAGAGGADPLLAQFN